MLEIVTTGSRCCQCLQRVHFARSARTCACEKSGMDFARNAAPVVILSEAKDLVVARSFAALRMTVIFHCRANLLTSASNHSVIGDSTHWPDTPTRKCKCPH